MALHLRPCDDLDTPLAKGSRNDCGHSLSQAAKIESRASSTVTLAPRSLSSDANSHRSHHLLPPQPIRALDPIEEFVRGEDQLPVDVESGSVRGTDPDARITWRPPVRCRRPPHRRSEPDDPAADIRSRQHGHLAALQQSNKALVELIYHRVLASLAHREINRRRSDLNAEVTARLTVRWTEAVSRNSLAGTHPRCRHVPPTLSRSIMAIESPAAAP